VSTAAEDSAEQAVQDSAEVESAHDIDTGAAGMLVAFGWWVGGRCAGARHGQDQTGREAGYRVTKTEHCRASSPYGDHRNVIDY
jgi:hypothetical protein